LEDGSEVMRSE